jgi:gamma-glutamylcyclotransferase (GGCT)/AIG2-like uncharacterized protein YtfP
LLYVFVYGTLKPGERFHHHYCASALVEAIPAWVQGLLYHLPAEKYPALTPGIGWVQGYRLKFAEPAILSTLDQLEAYQADRLAAENEYQRTLWDMFREPITPMTMSSASNSLGQAWVYWMEKTLIHQRQGVYLPDGYWSESRFDDGGNPVY